MANELLSGASLKPGEYRESDNGIYTFIFQTDGNLVLYSGKGTVQEQALWSPRADGKGGVICTMQTDGNLAILDAQNKQIWSSNTKGGGSYVKVQDDGNTVIYDAAKKALWSTHTVRYMYNPKLKNITDAYAAISDDGEKIEYDGEPWIADMVSSHIQGVAYYGNYIIFAHNNTGYSHAKMIVVNTKTNKMVHDFDIPIKDFNHPGGIQVIGSFLAVPLETGPSVDDHQSYILFYDLSVMTDTERPFLLTHPRIDRTSGAQKKKAGGVGITNYTKSGKEYYQVAVFDNNDVDIYTSNEYPLGDNRCNFSFTKNLTITVVEDGNMSELSLLTSEDQNINMIGFVSVGDFIYEDHLMLYDKDGKEIRDRHFKTNHGSIKGVGGVHFRWGAGLMIETPAGKSPELTVYCTQRNFTGGHVMTNSFFTE